MEALRKARWLVDDADTSRRRIVNDVQDSADQDDEADFQREWKDARTTLEAATEGLGGASLLDASGQAARTALFGRGDSYIAPGRGRDEMSGVVDDLKAWYRSGNKLASIPQARRSRVPSLRQVATDALPPLGPMWYFTGEDRDGMHLYREHGSSRETTHKNHPMLDDSPGWYWDGTEEEGPDGGKRRRFKHVSGGSSWWRSARGGRRTKGGKTRAKIRRTRTKGRKTRNKGRRRR